MRSLSILVIAALACGVAAHAQDELPPSPRADVGGGLEIVDYAAEVLREHLASRTTSLELDPVGSATAPCDWPQIEGAEVAQAAAPAPRMLTTVRVRCEDGTAATVPVWFKVKAQAPVVVAARDLPSGAALTAEDVRVEQLDVTRVRGGTVAPGTDPAGLLVATPVKAGAPLLQAAVRTETDVIAQQPVVIRTTAGAVKIEIMGLALQNGRIGDRVQVLNLSSGDTLLARVTHSRAVEIVQ